jgi:hypothetical protein
MCRTRSTPELYSLFPIEKPSTRVVSWQGLRLRFAPGVSPDTRLALMAFARWLRKEMRMTHPMEAIIVAAPKLRALYGPELDVVCLGWFQQPPVKLRTKGGLSRMWVAADNLEWEMRRSGFTYKQALDHLLNTFVHECVHYEQFHLRRKLDERNVEPRADALVERYIRTLKADRFDDPRARLALSQIDRRYLIEDAA